MPRPSPPGRARAGQTASSSAGATRGLLPAEPPQRQPGVRPEGGHPLATQSPVEAPRSATALSEQRANPTE
eukprot:573966-Alexandrium_andersonii.AAC.1